MTLRKALFWMHLIAGTIAGVIIMVMSVTGVMLTYEKQILGWSARSYRANPGPGAQRMPMEALITKVRESQKATPSTITVRSDGAAPVELGFGRERTVYVDPFSGNTVGEGSKGLAAFFHAVTDWHRWLGVEGEGRATARAITGACNLAFLFLVLSGFYLWWPKKWTWQHLKPVVLFRGGLSGKARDFNWHNVAGFWCAIPLVFVVATGVVFSYPWAGALIYTLTGTEAPTFGERGGEKKKEGKRGEKRGEKKKGGGGPGGFAGFQPPPLEWNVEGLNGLWEKAEQQMTGWRTIVLRLPPSEQAPLTFALDAGNGGRPDLKAQVTLSRQTGEVVRAEPYSSYNAGRKARLWIRWIHTGEAGGLIGQTVAGIASAAGALLVWTGLFLSWRRFQAWRARKVRGRAVELAA